MCLGNTVKIKNSAVQGHIRSLNSAAGKIAESQNRFVAFCVLKNHQGRVRTGLLKETLIYAAFPEVQGCTFISKGVKPLEMEESENRIFAFRALRNPRMDLFSASIKRKAA